MNVFDLRILWCLNTSMKLERDIVERIQRDFSPGDAVRAIEMLTDSGHIGRVARCLVVAAHGSIQTLNAHRTLFSTGQFMPRTLNNDGLDDSNRCLLSSIRDYGGVSVDSGAET